MLLVLACSALAFARPPGAAPRARPATARAMMLAPNLAPRAYDDEEDSRPPFDFDRSVELASLAFHTYVPVTGGKWERGSDKTDVAFQRAGFVAECYSGVLVVTLKRVRGLPDSAQKAGAGEALLTGGALDPYVLLSVVEGRKVPGKDEGAMPVRDVCRSRTQWRMGEGSSPDKAGSGKAAQADKGKSKPAPGVVEFDETFYLYVSDLSSARLRLTLRDENVAKEDDTLGIATLPIAPMAGRPGTELAQQLVIKYNAPVGPGIAAGAVAGGLFGGPVGAGLGAAAAAIAERWMREATVELACKFIPFGSADKPAAASAGGAAAGGALKPAAAAAPASAGSMVASAAAAAAAKLGGGSAQDAEARASSDEAMAAVAASALSEEEQSAMLERALARAQAQLRARRGGSGNISAAAEAAEGGAASEAVAEAQERFNAPAAQGDDAGGKGAAAPAPEPASKDGACAGVVSGAGADSEAAAAAPAVLASKLAQVEALGGTEGIDWTTLGGERVNPRRFELIAYIDNSETDTQATVWRDSANREVVLSFRGTEQTAWKDLMIDAMVMQQPWSQGGADGAGKRAGALEPSVHSGFRTAWASVAPRVLELIAGAIGARAFDPDARARALRRPRWTLYCTGHSLGGALATLAALEIGQSALPLAKIGLYTFGAPRVGNADLCALVDSYVPEAFRIVNGQDLVTRMPRGAAAETLGQFAGGILDYSHPGRTVLVDEREPLCAVAGAGLERECPLEVLDSPFADPLSSIDDARGGVGPAGSRAAAASPVDLDRDGVADARLLPAISALIENVAGTGAADALRGGASGGGSGGAGGLGEGALNAMNALGALQRAAEQAAQSLSEQMSGTGKGVSLKDVAALVGIDGRFVEAELSLLSSITSGVALAHHLEPSYFEAMKNARIAVSAGQAASGRARPSQDLPTALEVVD